MINYKNLKQLRIRRKFTLQDMAQTLGFETAGGYSRLESGENKLRAEHLPTLADKFDMKLNEFTDFIFCANELDECSTKY